MSVILSFLKGLSDELRLFLPVKFLMTNFLTGCLPWTPVLRTGGALDFSPPADEPERPTSDVLDPGRPSAGLAELAPRPAAAEK